MKLFLTSLSYSNYRGVVTDNSKGENMTDNK